MTGKFMGNLSIAPSENPTGPKDIGLDEEPSLVRYQDLMRRYALEEFGANSPAYGSSRYYDWLRDRDNLVELNKRFKGPKLKFPD